MPSPVHYVLFAVTLWLCWILFKVLRPRKAVSLRFVAVLVLGDIGRSPRMMYHAQSFADNGFQTHIIGYGGLNCIYSPLLTISLSLRIGSHTVAGAHT
jgi:beta-1,4-mannosyltransferase